MLTYVITYGFQSESVLHICLNVKEPLTYNRHNIWSLSDSNGFRTNNHFENEHSTIEPNWPNGWVFVCKLSGCGFKSRCCLLGPMFLEWYILKTSGRRLKEVLKTSWRHLENVLKTSWRCLEDLLTRWVCPLRYVFKTPWRRLTDILSSSWRWFNMF